MNIIIFIMTMTIMTLTVISNYDDDDQDFGHYLYHVQIHNG